jgi:hypothetical protein
MSKWVLQSEKPIQDHFTRPCWVQFDGNIVEHATPDFKILSSKIDGPMPCFFMKRFIFADSFYASASLIYPEDVIAWQYAEMPPKPEPYVPPHVGPRMKAEWVDGAVRVPDWPQNHSGFLIREKGHRYHKAVEWAPWAQEFFG